MIRIARYDDIEQILNIVKETIEDLQKEGNYQWGDDYPTKEYFLEDIKNASLYIFERNNEVAGFICLNKQEDEAYKKLNWQKQGEAIVIHRFAVKRSYQNQRIGSKLLEFAENLARNKGINYLKVDTNSKNKKMNAFFQKHGFKFVGQIYLRKVPDPFNCYEKVLE